MSICLVVVKQLFDVQVIPKSLNPEWNQHYDFMVEDAMHDMLLVDVYDHDTFVEVSWKLVVSICG